MVRLKDLNLLSITTTTEFQFQYGTIESLNSIFSPDLLYCFNSSMVRLKEVYAPECALCVLSFNSSMVRLKAVKFSNTAESPKFQFQYGTIERAITQLTESGSNEFQFQYGTIERRMRLNRIQVTMVSIPVWYD